MLPLQEMSVNFCKNDEEKDEKNEKDQPTNSHLRARNCRVKKTTAGTKIKKKTKTMITCGFELVACFHKK